MDTIYWHMNPYARGYKFAPRCKFALGCKFEPCANEHGFRIDLFFLRFDNVLGFKNLHVNR